MFFFASKKCKILSIPTLPFLVFTKNLIYRVESLFERVVLLPVREFTTCLIKNCYFFNTIHLMYKQQRCADACHWLAPSTVQDVWRSMAQVLWLVCLLFSEICSVCHWCSTSPVSCLVWFDKLIQNSIYKTSRMGKKGFVLPAYVFASLYGLV